MLMAIGFHSLACVNEGGLVGGPRVDHVDLRHRRKESAAPNAAGLHER
jgi:hypothetical protein